MLEVLRCIFSWYSLVHMLEYRLRSSIGLIEMEGSYCYKGTVCIEKKWPNQLFVINLTSF
jgi:hypothetical protein